MSKIAIDVVLLPSEEVMEKAIAINREIDDQQIWLNREDCVPHITLCLGVIQEQGLEKVSTTLKEICKEFSPLKLTIKPEILQRSFNIIKTKELQQLHETIVNRIDKFLSHNVTPEQFHTAPEPDASVLKKVKKFATTYSFQNYWPHITLSRKEFTKTLKKEINFTASRLAIYHLASYGRCRKILYEVELR